MKSHYSHLNVNCGLERTHEHFSSAAQRNVVYLVAEGVVFLHLDGGKLKKNISDISSSTNGPSNVGVE